MPAPARGAVLGDVLGAARSAAVGPAEVTRVVVAHEGPVGVGNVAEVPGAVVHPGVGAVLRARPDGALAPPADDAVARAGVPEVPAPEAQLARAADAAAVLQRADLRLREAAVPGRVVRVAPAPAAAGAKHVRAAAAEPGHGQLAPAPGVVPGALTRVARGGAASAPHGQDGALHVPLDGRLRPGERSLLASGAHWPFLTSSLQRS